MPIKLQIHSIPDRLKPGPSGAWKFALLYLIAGLLFVLVTDLLQYIYLRSKITEEFILSQTAAGMFFIILSAAGLYAMLRHYFRSVVRYEEVLRESEGRLQLALDNLPTVFVIYDNKLRFTFVNALGVALSGHSAEEMLGHTDEELFNERNTIEYLPILKRTLEHREPQSGECRVHLPDGRNVVSMIQYVPLLNKEGNVTQIFGITHNITDRVEAESALRHSEEQFRLLAENLPGLVYICRNDPDYSTIYISRRVETMLGYAAEQFSNEVTFASLIHPKDIEAVSFEVETALAEGRPFQLVYRIRHASGEWRWVQEQGEGIYKRGQLEFLQGFMIDITQERKERHKQELLSKMGSDLAAVNTLEKLGNVVLEAVSSIWQWDAFMFSVRHSGQAKIRILVQADTINGEKKFESPRVAIMPDDLRRHEPLLILRDVDDLVTTAGRFGDLSRPSQSLMYCPIQAGQGKNGLISIQSYTPGFYNDDDLDLLKVVAEAIAPAAHRCRIEERSRAFSRLGEHLNAATTPEEAAQIIVMVADELIGWDACGIELYVPNENLLYDLVSYDIIDAQRSGIPLRSTPIKPGGYYLQALENGQVLILRDKLPNPEDVLNPFGDTSRASASMMFVAMRGQAQITGIVSLHSYTFKAYDAEDLQVLQSLSNHCSNALERTRAQQTLQTRERNYRNAITSAGAVPYQLDYVTKSYVFMGEGIEAITGWSAEEFTVPLWNSMVREVVQAGTSEKLDRRTSETEPKGHTNATWRADIRIVTKSGESRWVTDTSVDISGEDGQFRGSLGILQDISDRKENENKLLYDSLHDPLTGLANRALLLDHMQLAIHRSQRRSTYCFAVLFIDIDRFKTVNDSLGHIAGDELLQIIAQRLMASVRPDDTVARFAGDEFVLLLDDICSAADVVPVAERILQEIQMPVTLDGHEVFTSVSMGIALSSPTYQQPEELLRDADNALYQAKSAGKARFELFNPSMYHRAVETFALGNDMRRALERKEFILHYQPIVDLETGSIVKFEALIRWNHPDRGLVPPIEFISMAEETGIIIPMGFWIIEEAVSQLRKWQDSYPSDPPLIISINMSVRQFSVSDLDVRILNIVKAHDIDPRCVKLEITETVFLEQQSSVVSLLNRLKDMGFGLSLDDFGTGYSSLSNLHQFPIEWVKIDRSFTSRLEHAGKEREIVRSIVQLAYNLGIGVTAEGVETADQLAILADMNCCHVQGYYLSRPLPADQATALLAARPNYLQS